MNPASQPAGARQPKRRVIFNADDFGASTGVNRGIIDCHEKGVLTSTSLMVTGRALDEAAALSREHPELSVGLHFDVWGEDEREFDISNIDATGEEFRRQLDAFLKTMDRPPTHVDSHRHVHRESHLFDAFRSWVEPLGVPVRGDGRARFVGGFYAQWEWKVTDLEYVSVGFLQRILREEVAGPWTEISTHPGYVSPDYRAVYLAEREEEIKTLTDPRIPATITELGIVLAGFADFPAEEGADHRE